MKARAGRDVLGKMPSMRGLLGSFALVSLPLALFLGGASCAAKGPGPTPEPSKARQCAQFDTFSRELKPGCRAEYLCDVNGHWLSRTPACAMYDAKLPPPPPPPPAPPACPTAIPPVGSPCEGPLTCLMHRQCAANELGGEAYFVCEAGGWRSLSDRPCVPPCSAAVAKSRQCGATAYCYLTDETCAHAGCWASAWNDGTKGDTPWPCAPPEPPPEPPSPASCSRKAAGQQELAQCKWTVGTMSYCGGAAPPRDMPMSWPGCLCNGCVDDRDCAGGSVCASLGSTSYCLPEAKVCVKKAECLGDKRTCAAGCLHDGAGHGGCFPHEPPRP